MPFTVSVLGDSSSCGLGGSRDVYPYRLFAELSSSSAVRVENHSSPGLTASDAARYYAFTMMRARPPDVLVLYLGNNDGSRCYHKGIYQARYDISRLIGLARRRRRRSPAPQAAPYGFDPSASDERQVAATAREFETNLTSIVTHARSRETRVILVNPIANRAFPACAGLSTSPFFLILGTTSRLPNAVQAVDAHGAELVTAIRAHERGDVREAATRYEAIRAAGGPAWAAAANNQAVLFADAGDDDGARKLLMSLTHVPSGGAAVAAFNLARLCERSGCPEQAEWYRTAAAEWDIDLYRIKQDYREAIRRVADRTDSEIVDLEGCLTAADFVDYCHPTARGHQTIARALAARIASADEDKRAAHERSEYVQYYPSPDSFREPRATLLDYYGLDEGRSVVATFRNAARHPVITEHRDFERWTPGFACEIGPLHEQYIWRILWSYAAFADAKGISAALDGEDAAADGELADTYRRRIISRHPIEPHASLDLTDAYAERVLNKAIGICRTSEAIVTDVRATRTVTVLHWYTREAFRYGTQSRLSMLYQAVDIDAIVDGLRVAAIVSRYTRRRDLESAAVAVFSKLTMLRSIHERFAEAFVRNGYRDAGDRDVYARELAQWRNANRVDDGAIATARRPRPASARS